jgi:hypothetical protein
MLTWVVGVRMFLLLASTFFFGGWGIGLLGRGMRIGRATSQAARSSGLVCEVELFLLSGRCRLRPEPCGVASRPPRRAGREMLGLF